MIRLTPTVNGLAILLALGVLIAPAHAQLTRTFVSVNGSDANNCARSTPCRTFQAAHDKTNAGGEIDVLDTAGYGTVSITKGISIIGNGEGAVLSTGVLGVSINVGASESVNLRNLVIEGAGSGTVGVQLVAGGSLAIENCVIRGFTSKGINFVPSGSSQLFVRNTVVSDNPGAASFGIFVQPSVSGSARAVLEGIAVVNNEIGIRANGSASTAGPVEVTLFGSVVSHNVGEAVSSESATGKAKTTVVVRNSALAENGTGVIASGGQATLRIAGTTITGNATASFQVLLSGTIESYGDNYIDGNGAPTGTLASISKQ